MLLIEVGSYSPATYISKWQCNLEDLAEATRAVRWHIGFTAILKVQTKTAIQAQKVWEKSFQATKIKKALGTFVWELCGVGMTGDLRAEKLTGRLLGLRYRLNLNAQQWKRKARCLKPNPVGIMVSGWDMSGMSKKQIKDDKGSLSNLYFQTSKNLSLGSRILDSTLKIQNNLTIAGGNAQWHSSNWAVSKDITTIMLQLPK